MHKMILALCGTLLCTIAGATEAIQVRGDYVEARTADIYTGPCFSNSEVFITGDRAVMAWKVAEGSWNGVDVSGLSVAAAIQATTTLSEDDPEQAKSVLIVDAQANPEQRDALIAMAKAMAGTRLNNVVDVQTTAMNLNIEVACHEDADEHCSAGHHNRPQAPVATFNASGLAEILTRPLGGNDCICGNEVVAYAPLSEGVEVLPAYTLGHAFEGHGLNGNWNDPNCRSSFVGHFAF